MPLSDSQVTALANFAGLRKGGDGAWRTATVSELIDTPSPLKTYRDIALKQTQQTADFLKGIDRLESTLGRTVIRRTAKGTSDLLNSLLTEPGG